MEQMLQFFWKVLFFKVQFYGMISRAHSFPRAAEFRAEPRNLAIAA